MRIRTRSMSISDHRQLPVLFMIGQRQCKNASIISDLKQIPGACGGGQYYMYCIALFCSAVWLLNIGENFERSSTRDAIDLIQTLWVYTQNDRIVFCDPNLIMHNKLRKYFSSVDYPSTESRTTNGKASNLDELENPNVAY